MKKCFIKKLLTSHRPQTAPNFLANVSSQHIKPHDMFNRINILQLQSINHLNVVLASNCVIHHINLSKNM
jgi:hypothetical protein